MDSKGATKDSAVLADIQVSEYPAGNLRYHPSAGLNSESNARHMIFAHGAGAGSHHPFMLDMVSLLNAQSIDVWTFDFGYMHRGLIENKKRPPTRLPSLILEYQHIIEQVRARINDAPLWLGGKSMGGRVACHVLQEYQHGNLPEQQSFPKQIQGGLVIGYPFHPAAKPEKLRLEVLQSSTHPILICQGERDALGSQAQISEYAVPDNVQVQFFVDGDHSLYPRKASGLSQAEHMQQAAISFARLINGKLVPR